MPHDAENTHSLAYRKDRAAIWDGRVPAKYTRLVPHVPPGTVLELGAAEGVLALLLARLAVVDRVVALELRAPRHEESRRLRDRWTALGYDVRRCDLVLGDIRARLDLLQGIDTLIAVRALYYLRDQAVPVLTEAARQSVGRVVLCGNRGRQARHRQTPHDELGRFNRLAATEGMRDALEQAGYSIDTVIDEGDPIVVGRHPHRA